jgi:hypothetical protein
MEMGMGMTRREWEGTVMGQFPLKGKKINNTLLSNTNLAAVHLEKAC